jgi:hypothetical protein
MPKTKSGYKKILVWLVVAFPVIAAFTFVTGTYFYNKASISADTASSGCSVPAYKQTAGSWAGMSYGMKVNDNTGEKTPATVASSGCGPTAAAMVLKYWTNNSEVTPGVTAKHCLDNGYRRTDGGPYNFPGCLSSLANRYHLKVDKISASDAQSKLKWHSQGTDHYLLPIIMTVGPCLSKKYTAASHYIVLTKIVGGTVYINDPNKNNTSDSVSNIFESCAQNGYWYIHT